MGWFFAAALALLAFALIAWLTSWKSEGWMALGAVLLAGLAGYAAQGRPTLAGSPRISSPQVLENPEALVEARMMLSGRPGLPTDGNVLRADAHVRHGDFAQAVEWLNVAVEQQPSSSEAWLALANALVAHAQGTLSPAALYAYRHAALADPQAPGPPWFLGLALAQSGRFSEARAIWAQVLAQAPQDAPWRADLAEKLQRLDQLIAQQQASGTGR